MPAWDGDAVYACGGNVCAGLRLDGEKGACGGRE